MIKYLILKNKRTGEERKVKQGFNWAFFLFSGFAGIPLFIKGLYGYGLFFAIYFVVSLIYVGTTDTQELEILGGLGLFLIACQIDLGFRGNQMIVNKLVKPSARNYTTSSDWFVEKTIEDCRKPFRFELLIALVCILISAYNFYAAYSIETMTDNEKKQHYLNHVKTRKDYEEFLALEGFKSAYSEEVADCEASFADEALEACIGDINKEGLINTSIRSAKDAVKVVGLPGSSSAFKSSSGNIIWALLFSIAAFVFFREGRKKHEE